MGFERKIGRAIAGLTLLLAATGAIGASSEPSFIMRLPDRVTKFVPLPEPKLERDTASDQLYGNPAPDQALQEFSRAIGQVLKAQQQAIDERCKSAESAGGNASARWAWEANCRYQRH